MSDYYSKYLKYKNKYINLKNTHQIGGANCLKYGYQQHSGECWHDSLSMLMMQSDGLKDIFIPQLKVVNVDDVHRNLVALFAPENIDRNAYLLPFSIYIYYLRNKADVANINRIIIDFLNLSKEYVKNHIQRALNRISYDEEMSRYGYDRENPDDEHPFDFFTDVTQLQEELRAATIPKEQTRIRRRMSVHVTNVCTHTINEIYSLISDDSLGMIKIKKQGGNIGHIILAMEILNMYIIRSKPEYNYLYLDIIVVNTRPDDIDSNYNKTDYEDLLKVLNETLLGVLLHIDFSKNADHATSLYKCDKEELFYDNNSSGPKKIPWHNNIHEYLVSNGDQAYLSPLHNTLNRMYDRHTKHKLQIINLLFTRKRMFSGDTNIDREAKFILNKLNKFLQDSEISLLLERLFEITGTTIDNFDTQLGKYIKRMTPSSLFNKPIFSVHGIVNILNKGAMPDSEIIDRFDNMF